jgi:hypothetical protein
MTALTDLRTGLANRLATISGLRSSAYIPDNPQPPVAVVMPGRIQYDTAFGRGSDEYQFTIMLIVGRVADRASQTTLDGYCESSGSRSVKAAIEGDRSLGGKALDCRVTEMTNQGSLAIGDVTYHTAEFSVTVIAAG